MTKSDLRSLRIKWSAIEKKGTDWKSFEDFAHWAESEGYALGKKLYKLNESETHGPQNSFWYMQRDDLPDVISPFCEGCTRICPKHGAGCFEWKEYWIKKLGPGYLRKDAGETERSAERE